MTEHVPDDLPALLSGDLPREQTTQVVAHLKACDACCRSLVSTAAATGALLSSARVFGQASPFRAHDHLAAEPLAALDAELPPLQTPRRPRARLAAAAAVIALLAAGGIAWVTRDAGGPASPASVQTAALRATSGSDARGVVTMRLPGRRTDMTVATKGLTAPGPGQFYEVWLFEPTTSKMVGIGVLAPDGRASFHLPAALVTAYAAVDVSLQRDDGNPRHSSHSVLRGRYS